MQTLTTHTQSNTRHLWIAFAALALLLAPATYAKSAESHPSDFEMSIDNTMTELAVKTELLEKIGWDMLTVDVEASGDKIYLNGTADNKANKQLAKEVALAVEGVDRVNNNLTVEAKPTDTPVADTVANAESEVRDALLESRVKTELITTLGTAGFGISVEATDGKVSLRGNLDTDEHESLALKVTENCKGVDEVIDLLSVESTR